MEPTFIPEAASGMVFIEYGGKRTLSFRQVDELNRLTKGSAFRLFKRFQAEMAEGNDYFYLDGAGHAGFIDALRRDGRIYPATVNLVLITETGYALLRRRTGGGI